MVSFLRRLGSLVTGISLAAFLLFIAIPEGAQLCSASSGNEDKDCWYEDLSGHWANQYVRTLWEEEVANGFKVTRYVGRPGHRRPEVHWYFYPDSMIDRAQFAILMVKVFDMYPFWPTEPTFSDVKKDFSVYNQKPAYGYIEAACQSGLVTGRSNTKFGPDDDITREQAVSSLVKGLGLGWYSSRLTRTQRELILSRFKDYASVDPQLAGEMATAVRFKIVQGYPDGRLKPQKNMTRAEAATICYRSCLVKVLADPATFSPDGDGYDDTVTLLVKGLKNRNISAWQVEISDASHKPVLLAGNGRVSGRPRSLRSPSPGSSEAGVIGTVVWDGLDMESRPLPAGMYYYRAFAQDREGQVFESIEGPIWLIKQSLSGHVHPKEIVAGGSLEVYASTTGYAKSVTVLAGSLGSLVPIKIDLASAKSPGESDNTWNGSLPVPLDSAAGLHELRMTAEYENGSSRSLVLSFEVKGIKDAGPPGTPEAPGEPDQDDKEEEVPGTGGPGSQPGSGETGESNALEKILISLTD